MKTARTEDARYAEMVARANHMLEVTRKNIAEAALRDFVNAIEDAIFDRTYIGSDFKQVIDSQVLLAEIYTLMRKRGISPNHDTK